MPWIAIVAAVSLGASRGRAFSDRAFSSRNAMHLDARRTARARSIGEGIPPWSVWPSEADRESNTSPSSLRILVMRLVVYTDDAFSFLSERLNTGLMGSVSLPEYEAALALALDV